MPPTALHKFPFPLLTFSSQFIQIYDFQSHNWFELFHLAAVACDQKTQTPSHSWMHACVCMCAAPSDEPSSKVIIPAAAARRAKNMQGVFSRAAVCAEIASNKEPRAIQSHMHTRSHKYAYMPIDWIAIATACNWQTTRERSLLPAGVLFRLERRLFLIFSSQELGN